MKAAGGLRPRPRLLAAAGGIALIYAVLAALAWAGSAGPVALAACAASVAVVLWWSLRNSVDADLDGLGGWLLIAAVLLRLIGLAGGPMLEDDYWRYLWDGYRLLTVGTPYGAAPAEFVGDPAVPAAMQAVLAQVNYPDLPTIYGPALQLLFAAGQALTPGAPLGLQLIFSLVDLGLIVLLWRLAPDRRWVLVYACAPLVIKEVAFTAHPDGVMAAAMLGAVALRARRRAGWAGVLLGIALCTKPHAMLLAPFLLLGTPRLRPAQILHAVAATLITTTLLYAPFVAQGAVGLFSLGVFAQFWIFNPALFGILNAALDGFARPVAASLLVAWLVCLLWRHWRRPGTAPRVDLIFGGLLALSPVINAWYLLWLLPFAVLWPSRTAWTAAFTVLLAYWHSVYLPWLDTPAFVLPWWVQMAEFGPVLIALALDWRYPLPAGGLRSASRPMQPRMW